MRKIALLIALVFILTGGISLLHAQVQHDFETGWIQQDEKDLIILPGWYQCIHLKGMIHGYWIEEDSPLKRSHRSLRIPNPDPIFLFVKYTSNPWLTNPPGYELDFSNGYCKDRFWIIMNDVTVFDTGEQTRNPEQSGKHEYPKTYSTWFYPPDKNAEIHFNASSEAMTCPTPDKIGHSLSYLDLHYTDALLGW